MVPKFLLALLGAAFFAVFQTVAAYAADNCQPLQGDGNVCFPNTAPYTVSVTGGGYSYVVLGTGLFNNQPLTPTATNVAHVVVFPGANVSGTQVSLTAVLMTNFPLGYVAVTNITRTVPYAEMMTTGDQTASGMANQPERCGVDCQTAYLWIWDWTTAKLTLRAIVVRSQFTDISSLDLEVQTAINKLAAGAIMSGTSATTFDPNGLITRASMAQYLVATYKAIKGSEPPSNGANCAFTDIGDLTAQQQTWIKQICTLGVTNGIGNNLYAPTANVNRVQMAAFIMRLYWVADGPIIVIPLCPVCYPFDDMAGYDWAKGDAHALYQAGIAKGTGERSFSPATNVPRWQMALFLNRLLSKFGK